MFFLKYYLKIYGIHNFLDDHLSERYHKIFLIKTVAMKKICVLIFLLFDVFSCIAKIHPFSLDPMRECILGGSGILLSGGDLLLDNVLKVNRKEWNWERFDKHDVNKFDRFFMHEYSRTKDKAADVLLTASLLSGVIFPVTSFFEHDGEYKTSFVMYAQTLLLANGVKEILKLCINRTRPYMYYDYGTWPKKEVDAGDFANSFPSGHTTMAFAGATYTSYVFCRYYPDSDWKFPVVSASYLVAASVATLRMLSGNHFATDVLTGAITGSFFGILVPWLHTFSKENSFKISVHPKGISFLVEL